MNRAAISRRAGIETVAALTSVERELGDLRNKVNNSSTSLVGIPFLGSFLAEPPVPASPSIYDSEKQS